MLQFTAQQIAIMIQGLVDGDPTAAVNNFGKIEEWRHQKAIEITQQKRPDLLKDF